jgi:hypothetical protein
MIVASSCSLLKSLRILSRYKGENSLQSSKIWRRSQAVCNELTGWLGHYYREPTDRLHPDSFESSGRDKTRVAGTLQQWDITLGGGLETNMIVSTLTN